MQTIVPCLWFDHQAVDAMKAYQGIFPTLKVGATSYYSEANAEVSKQKPGSVMVQEFAIDGLRISALNGGDFFRLNPSISFFIVGRSEGELRERWNKLSKGGAVRMELGAYPWSSLYGWTADAFGVEWQLMLAPEGETSIAPCLLFTQDNYGRAHEAIETYLSLFPNSEILSMAKNPDGKHVDHCAFTLAGQRFVVMDGAGEHDFRFNEAFSFQVLCRNQAEIDRYWTELGKGGRHGPCGWLSDKFGVSWQIIPDKLEVWMRDRARSERVMAVLMKMGKLDWKALENA